MPDVSKKNKNYRPKDSATWWDRKHKQEPLAPGPMEFARFCMPWFNQFGVQKILELGFGQLNDALWFSEQGIFVHGLDISAYATEKAKNIICSEHIANIVVENYDYAYPLMLTSSSFDAVYSHLALHYFDDKTTTSIFKEVHRVLKKQGLLLFSVKSVNDIQYGKGNLIGPDIYDDAGDPGHIRHFFTLDKLVGCLPNFNIVEVEEKKVHYMGTRSTCFQVVAKKK